MSSRAVVVTRHGGPDVLEVQGRDVPPAGPGQLVVEVAASGVNFIDVYRRQGIYPSPPPFVLGEECAGTVTAVGDGVSGFVVGDVVATAAGGHGTHATHAVIDADKAVPVPDGLDPALAAAAMLQGMTAHYLVTASFVVAAGHTVLVHAAAGGVGQLLVQLAKARGATVIGTVGSAAKVEVARAAGADTVIRYDRGGGADQELADLAAAVRSASGGGVHAVYDGVGRATFDASLDSLRVRGTLALYGGASGQVPPFDLQRLNRGGSLTVTRPSLVHFIAERDELLWRSGEVLGAVASGALRLEIGARYPLDDAADAYRDLEGRRTTGKLLIVP